MVLILDRHDAQACRVTDSARSIGYLNEICRAQEMKVLHKIVAGGVEAMDEHL